MVQNTNTFFTSVLKETAAAVQKQERGWNRTRQLPRAQARGRCSREQPQGRAAAPRAGLVLVWGAPGRSVPWESELGVSHLFVSRRFGYGRELELHRCPRTRSRRGTGVSATPGRPSRVRQSGNGFTSHGVPFLHVQECSGRTRHSGRCKEPVKRLKGRNWRCWLGGSAAAGLRPWAAPQGRLRRVPAHSDRPSGRRELPLGPGWQGRLWQRVTPLSLQDAHAAQPRSGSNMRVGACEQVRGSRPRRRQRDEGTGCNRSWSDRETLSPDRQTAGSCPLASGTPSAA